MNGSSPSQTHQSALPGALTWPSYWFSGKHTHIYVCREQQWLMRTFCIHTTEHIHKHMRHASPLAELWLEPAALTQQNINHWALSSTAGPQCHAELDSTGIKVCNWIQKLIQARDNCWHTEAREVLIPPLWRYASSVMRPLTSAVRRHRPARCYWSEMRERGAKEWGQAGKGVMKT